MATGGTIKTAYLSSLSLISVALLNLLLRYQGPEPQGYHLTHRSLEVAAAGFPARCCRSITFATSSPRYHSLLNQAYGPLSMPSVAGASVVLAYAATYLFNSYLHLHAYYAALEQELSHKAGQVDGLRRKLPVWKAIDLATMNSIQLP